jgi:hypothetical protein
MRSESDDGNCWQNALVEQKISAAMTRCLIRVCVLGRKSTVIPLASFDDADQNQNDFTEF